MQEVNRTVVYALESNVSEYAWLIVSPAYGAEAGQVMGLLSEQFRGKPLPKPWHYPRLSRNPKRQRLPLGDLPASVVAVTLFSERAAEAMRPLIEHCGEFLPLDWAEGRLVAFNVCPLVDAIDFGRCDQGPTPKDECWLPEMRPDLAFRDEVIERTPIFKVPQYTGTAFVTEAFKRRWEEAGLEGAEFGRVWPWPADPLRLW